MGGESICKNMCVSHNAASDKHGFYSEITTQLQSDDMRTTPQKGEAPSSLPHHLEDYLGYKYTILCLLRDRKHHSENGHH